MANTADTQSILNLFDGTSNLPSEWNSATDICEWTTSTQMSISCTNGNLTGFSLDDAFGLVKFDEYDWPPMLSSLDLSGCNGLEGTINWSRFPNTISLLYIANQPDLHLSGEGINWMYTPDPIFIDFGGTGLNGPMNWSIPASVTNLDMANSGLTGDVNLGLVQGMDNNPFDGEITIGDFGWSGASFPGCDGLTTANGLDYTGIPSTTYLWLPGHLHCDTSKYCSPSEVQWLDGVERSRETCTGFSDCASTCVCATLAPTVGPSTVPSEGPTVGPTLSPIMTGSPTMYPTDSPVFTESPSLQPSIFPTMLDDTRTETTASLDSDDGTEEDKSGGQGGSDMLIYALIAGGLILLLLCVAVVCFVSGRRSNDEKKNPKKKGSKERTNETGPQIRYVNSMSSDGRIALDLDYPVINGEELEEGPSQTNNPVSLGPTDTTGYPTAFPPPPPSVHQPY